MTGGTLTGTGPVSGTQSLSYDAQDNDTGVRFVQLRVDGQQVAQNDYIAKCPYTTFMACPASESDTISWNTTSVADGQHNLEVIVQNATQNTSIIPHRHDHHPQRTNEQHTTNDTHVKPTRRRRRDALHPAREMVRAHRDGDHHLRL